MEGEDLVRRSAGGRSLGSSERRHARRARGAPIQTTLGELVGAVASVTVDLAEQVVVVNHILRTRGTKRDL